MLLGVFLFGWEMFSLFLSRVNVLTLPGVLRPRPYRTQQHHNNISPAVSSLKKDLERTLLDDRGVFCIADWHRVPPRPELRKLVGVEAVALN